MDKYQRGKVYTIRCHTDDTMIYVGSTIETLSRRMTSHRNCSKNDKNKNRLIYEIINNNWDNWDNWYIELYELYPCNSKEELCKREGEVIREIGTLNNNIAGRSRKEWYEDNKVKIDKIRKEWYQNNKEKIKEQQKLYYEKNKEKIVQYNEENKVSITERMKGYYENNKPKLAEKAKVYREENKSKILEKSKEIVICQYCGCNSTKWHLPRHQKTKKCQTYQK